MPDNLTAPATGAVLATDDVGGAHVQRIKPTFGGDGVATDVSAENPLPVVQEGAATEAKQDANTAAINKLGSAKRWFPITPDGNTDLATIPDAVYVGGAGDVVLKGSDGTNATFSATAGQILPLSPTRVLSTGTTATGLVGLVS